MQVEQPPNITKAQLYTAIGASVLTALLLIASLKDKEKIGINITPSPTQPRVGDHTYLLQTATPWPGDGLDNTQTSTQPKPSQEQKNYVLENAMDPKRMISEQLKKGVRVVGIGELHTELDMELMAANIILELGSQKSIHFIALEIDDVYQPAVDNFLSTGEINPELQKILKFHNKGYIEILQAARRNGLKIYCVDNHDTEDRDKYMDKNILRILQGDTDTRGVFYAGNLHVTRIKDLLAGTLQRRFFSIIQLNERSAETGDVIYNAYLQTQLKNPIAVTINKGTPLSDVTFGFPYEIWSRYERMTDAVILLPENDK